MRPGPRVERRREVCYSWAVVTAKPAELSLGAVRAELAARVSAMFKRWSVEDVSDEPDWDIDQIERLRISSPPEAIEQSVP
jgi:hypothetical protein